jgi:hypothetical protein
LELYTDEDPEDVTYPGHWIELPKPIEVYLLLIS